MTTIITERIVLEKSGQMKYPITYSRNLAF